MRVLITGGTGFVGQYLENNLKQAGFEVISASRKNGLDVRNPKSVKEYFRKFQPDVIFHLAAVIRGRKWKEKKEMLITNVLGTQNVVEALANENPSALLIYISSSEVYGWAEPPHSENTKPLPANLYGITKLAGEHLILNGIKIWNLRALILRPFNHTGPGQSDDYLPSYIGKMFAEMKRGKRRFTLEIGNLDVRREFLDVRDVVEIYKIMIEKGKIGEIYNVCRGESYSIREVVKMYEDITGIDVELKISRKRVRVEPVEIKGNADKLRGEVSVDFRPLTETLKDIYEYWLERV